ncbi:MAG: threonine-phosphate decarboxylase CobD [Methylotenera sp.]|nr:threonine-phosphate decarboxylase CobD [Methylotenera sp.]
MLEHGGNLSLAAAQYGIPLEDWLDLSTGINPNNYPIAEIPADVWQKLPSDSDGLIEAACAYYGCQLALPTAGSQAALQVLPKLRPSCKVVMLDPMYKEHANAWLRHGHQVNTFTNLEDEEAINAADVVLLCNPNNPTATQFLPQALLNLHAKLASRGGWLIVDEAFMDATPEHSIAQHAHLDGLFVLRSLGKFFGLAGARVGFLLSKQTQLNKIQEELGPWTITGASRFIAKQALNDTTWQQNTRKQLVENSQRLASLLDHYGLTPQAGTVLFQYAPTNMAETWQRHLAKQGIWVRLFTETPALRFGLPTKDGWDKLENALKLF